MSRRIMLLLLVLVAVSAIAHTTPAFAQGNREIKVNSLQEIRQLNIPVHRGESVTYRVVNCSDSNSICSVIVNAVTPPSTEGFTILSSGTLVCGASFYNGLGVEIARIRNDQSTTFYNTYGYAPFSWNANPVGTYEAWGGWYWGPKDYGLSPAIGVQASYGTSQRLGQLFPPLGGNYTNHGAQIQFAGGPWYCSAW